MITVSVSLLENFRQMRDNDHFYEYEIMPEEKFLSYVQKTAPESDKASVGSAFHEILQKPHECFDRFTRYYKSGKGFRASNNIDFPFELIDKCLKHVNSEALTEISNEKIYEINGVKILVKARADAWLATKVDDYKVVFGEIYKSREGDIRHSSNFNYEKYHKSAQWRFYLDIFEANIFEYKVFDILVNKLNEGNFELEDIHEFQFYADPSVEDYIYELLRDFIDYIQFRKLEKYFTNTPGEKKVEELGLDSIEMPEFNVDDIFGEPTVENKPEVKEPVKTDKKAAKKEAVIEEPKEESGNKIYFLEIKNFLGIEHLQLTPKGGLIVRAKNGTGKTSVIKALKSALGGGAHDANLVRLGTEEAQIGLELANGMKINKRITREKQSLSVTQDGKKVAKAQTVLNELFDEFGTNPLDLLTAPAKLRVEILLDAIKLRLTEEEIQKTLDGDTIEITYNLEEHALDVIDNIKKQINEDRKGTKNVLDIKQKGYDNTSVNLMEVPGNPEEIEQTVERLEKEKSDLEVKKQKTFEDLAKKRDEMIEKLRAQFEEQKAKLEAQFDTVYNPKLEELANAKAAAKNIMGYLAQKQQLEKDRVEIEKLSVIVEKRTALLTRFEELKNDVKSRLPIPGLEIIDNEIYKDGIPFENLNTAEQMKLCIKIGSLHNNSGLMLVDGVERLDKANQDLLLELAKENGLQLIVTEVSEDTTLNIEPLGA